MIITIDGPAASGKTTVSRQLAQQIDFFYLGTGILYRAVAYLLLSDFKYDQEQLKNPLESEIQTIVNDLIYEYDPVKQETVSYKKKVLNSFLHDQFVIQAASIIAVNARVRKALVHKQRIIVDNKESVVEGRDAGSIVFPQAEFKFFLTASLQIRAQRLVADQKGTGSLIEIQKAMEQLQIRDARDQKREIAPLIIPHDAIVIDSTHATPQMVVQEIMSFLKKE